MGGGGGERGRVSLSSVGGRVYVTCKQIMPMQKLHVCGVTCDDNTGPKRSRSRCVVKMV